MPKPPAARLLEALVYAPIGLAVQVREDLPRLVADGKAELENRVRVARWVGEMAVHYGRRQMQEARAQRVAPAPAPAQAEPATTAPARPVPDHPFDGYHLLTAAELVPLLDRLPGAERDMVREYEQATRARRTVLAKLDGVGALAVETVVRPLAATDASDVAALEAEARLAIADARGGAALLAGSPPVGDWSGHVGDPTRPTWVGTIDDVVVAVLSLAVEGAIGRVQEVWVTPEARELGMGDELLATAVATARATGCTRLDGWALPGDRDTKNLYERAGITARLIVVSTPL